MLSPQTVLNGGETIRGKVYVWEPRALGISTRRRVSACGPRGIDFFFPALPDKCET